MGQVLLLVPLQQHFNVFNTPHTLSAYSTAALNPTQPYSNSITEPTEHARCFVVKGSYLRGWQICLCSQHGGTEYCFREMRRLEKKIEVLERNQCFAIKQILHTETILWKDCFQRSLKETKNTNVIPKLNKLIFFVNHK